MVPSERMLASPRLASRKAKSHQQLLSLQLMQLGYFAMQACLGFDLMEYKLD